MPLFLIISFSRGKDKFGKPVYFTDIMKITEVRRRCKVFPFPYMSILAILPDFHTYSANIYGEERFINIHVLVEIFT